MSSRSTPISTARSGAGKVEMAKFHIEETGSYFRGDLRSILDT